MYENDAELKRLIHVAKLYYEENLTQSEVAARMKVSRPLVSKLLTRAREMGIVTITIKSPLESNDMMAEKLMSLYGLKGALVVPEAKNDYMTEELILTQAARLMAELMQKARCVGLGWGFLMEAFVKQLPEVFSGREGNERSIGDVFPLIGGATVPNSGYNPNEIVRRFAEKSGLEPHYLFAPAFPLTQEERNNFTGTGNFREFEQLWSLLDLAVLRISNYPTTPDHATATRFGKKLTQKKAVGAILSYFYDIEGGFIKGDNDFCISISLEKLRGASNVVGICSSNSSAESIIGALRTGTITHVILDESKALKVIANG